MSKILARIASETGVPRLATVLSGELRPSDLQSLLLHVYQKRAAGIGESKLIQGYGRPLLKPSGLDGRLFHQFDNAAFSAAQAFEAIELSPVCPLGLNQVLGEIGQNNVLTTIRSAEVLGDPTPVMALEAARRRRDPKRRTTEVVRLCASQRVIRLQPFDVPGYSPHFRLFALVTAGRDTGSHEFEIRHLAEHIRCYLEMFRLLNARGLSLTKPLVEITDAGVVLECLQAADVGLEELRESIRAHKAGGSERFLAERGVKLPEAVVDPVEELPGLAPRHRLARAKAEIFDLLAPLFPEASFRFNLARLEGLGYYRGLCFRISPEAPDGQRYPIVDGGFTDWTARLLQDRKERLLATGIGSEFACLRYRSGVGS